MLPVLVVTGIFGTPQTTASRVEVEPGEITDPLISDGLPGEGLDAKGTLVLRNKPILFVHPNRAVLTRPVG